MHNIVVTGVACRGKTTLTKALAKEYNLTYVSGDEHAYEPKSWTRTSKEVFTESITRVLNTANTFGRGWVLDICIDASDATHRALDLVRSVLTPGTTCVLFTGGDLESTIHNIRARHEFRVRTGELICSGMEETDAAVERLIAKMTTNWDAIRAVYDSFEVPEGVKLVTLHHEPGTPQWFPNVEDVVRACGLTSK